MRILTVVGARPQFIKASIVSKKLIDFHDEIIVHTGQHYDDNMSGRFFSELGIPHPKYNLAVGSKSHAKQTGEMMIAIEDILLKEEPRCLIVYGDTNSTVAGALAASKLNIPVVHIEAGLRSFNKRMPEEKNRILTDHLSEVLFCPTETSAANLSHEGITTNVYNVGDVMLDSTIYFSEIANERYSEMKYLESIGLHSKGYYLATIHRAENTDDVKKISEILKSLDSLGYPVIFPVHPRIKKIVHDVIETCGYKNINAVEPVGYLEMLFLVKHACKVLTDSGGLQKEAYFLEVPCITLRGETEWVETLAGNWNILCDIDAELIKDRVDTTKIDFEIRKKNLFGNGNASEEISKTLFQLYH